MIKVLHIHTLPVISGSGINTFLSMRGLNKQAYQVELACAPGGRLFDLVQSHGIPVRRFHHLVQPLHPIKDVLALFDLTRFLSKHRYHIIHTHNSKAGFIGRLAGRLAGVPIIVHTVHGFAFHDREPAWKRYLILNLERLAAHWCDIMIFISQPLIDWALRDGVVKTRKKITKIYSGIEMERFSPFNLNEQRRARKKWGLGQSDKVIGIVSKLWEGKGHATLIRAFDSIRRRLNNAKLVIVGEGYLKTELEALVLKKKLKHSVIFTGFQADVSEIVACFDVVALPSFFEGMGRVLLEAAAMEKPVVASNVGGIPDIVENGVTGYLVPPGDDKKLAEAILKILENKDQAKEMGINGRKKIQQQFSAKNMVSAIEEVYQRLLCEKGIHHAAPKRF